MPAPFSRPRGSAPARCASSRRSPSIARRNAAEARSCAATAASRSPRCSAPAASRIAWAASDAAPAASPSRALPAERVLAQLALAAEGLLERRRRAVARGSRAGAGRHAVAIALAEADLGVLHHFGELIEQRLRLSALAQRRGCAQCVQKVGQGLVALRFGAGVGLHISPRHGLTGQFGKPVAHRLAQPLHPLGQFVPVGAALDRLGQRIARRLEFGLRIPARSLF
jgi:hypothetical protein